MITIDNIIKDKQKYVDALDEALIYYNQSSTLEDLYETFGYSGNTEGEYANKKASLNDLLDWLVNL